MTEAEAETYWDTLASPALRAMRQDVKRLHAEACRSDRTAGGYVRSPYAHHRHAQPVYARAADAWNAYAAAWNAYHCHARPAALAAVGLAHVPGATAMAPLSLR
jgi:hypothetical protein